MSNTTRSRAKTGGGAFLIFGLVFTIVGASSDSNFLWIGIPFLVSGLAGTGYAALSLK